MDKAQLRAKLNAARAAVAGRLRGAVAPEERSALLHSLEELDATIQEIDQAELLGAAALTADAADALSDAISNSRPPFDLFVQDLMTSTRDLMSEVGAMQGSERLPPAPDAPSSTLSGTTTTPPALAPAAPVSSVPTAALASPPGITQLSVQGAVPIPINRRSFNDLRDEYVAFFDSCRVNPERRKNVDFYVARLRKHKPTYAALGAELSMPWYFIGIVHGMEGGFDFSRHLHNGDPLTARTKQQPAGRPKEGAPPFTWIESARDALRLEKLDQIGTENWSLPRVLYMLEAYNGFGYRPRGIPSPYLWSFSNMYIRGKFVADKQFDPQAESRQCGAAVMLRALQEANLLQ